MSRTACSSFSLGGVSNDVIGRPEGYCICEVKTISPMFRPFESARELYTPDVFVTPMKSSPRVDFRGLRVTEKSLGHAKTQVDPWNLSHHGSCPLATAPGALRISAGHFIFTGNLSDGSDRFEAILQAAGFFFCGQRLRPAIIEKDYFVANLSSSYHRHESW